MADGPISLVQELNEIMTLLSGFKQGGQKPDDGNALKQRLKKLRDRLDAIAPSVERLDDPNRRPAALAEIERFVVIDTGISLDVFFRSVGAAVIRAQRALDRRFEEDLRASPTSGRISPVQYSIPTVHAEMKVGFSQVSSRGVNLLVFTNSQQKQNYSESTITFDIVAAPPPPNLTRLAGTPESPPTPPAAEDEITLEAMRSEDMERAVGAGARVDEGLELLEQIGAEETVGVEARPETGEPGGGVELEGAVGTRYFERAPPPIAATLTFPLSGVVRTEAIARLEESVSASERRQIVALRDSIVVVPSEGATNRGALLYLCPGITSTKVPRTRRAFRCYAASADAENTLRFQMLRRPDTLPAATSQRTLGLIVPVPPLTARERARIPDVLGGVGSALMHVVNGVVAFRPPFAVSPAEADIIEEINAELEAVPKLMTGEPWAILRVRVKGRMQVLEYLVLRPVFKPGTLEWDEFHVVGVSLDRRRPRTAHVHIPTTATLERWISDSPRNAQDVAARLEPLLRRVTAVIADDVRR